MNDNKYAVIVELNAKNSKLVIKNIPLKPMRDLSEISGTFSEITSLNYTQNCKVKNDYLRITLFDENDIPNAVSRLREYYKNIMILRYDNLRTRKNAIIDVNDGEVMKSPLELFSEFYKTQNNAEMSNEQLEYIVNLLERIKED